MKASHHDNLPIRRNIDQAVWESAQSCAAELPPYSLVLERVLLDRRQGCLHRTNKVSA
jgi:hypothetical protein